MTENEKRVILLFYYEDLALKEISDILGVSPSRISQLHSRALEKMRKILGDYIDMLAESA